MDLAGVNSSSADIARDQVADVVDSKNKDASSHILNSL